MSAPTCPREDCGLPCGTADAEALTPGMIRCAACGEDWVASEQEWNDARDADAAHIRKLEIEERDAVTHRRMTDEVRETNRRMLARPKATPARTEQLDMFGVAQ